MISKEYEAPVRDIVLKAVKNRFGRASFTVYFTYEAAYDNFIQGSQVACASRKQALPKDGSDENSFMVDAFSKKG